MLYQENPIVKHINFASIFSILEKEIVLKKPLVTITRVGVDARVKTSYAAV